MNKLREQNKIAEIATMSDYDIAASSLRIAITCIDVAGKSIDKTEKMKWLRLARAKMDVAGFYVDDLSQ